MHTYRQTGATWTVGFRRPASGMRGTVDKFEDMREFDSEDEAAHYTCWLNGGNAPVEYLNAYLRGTVETTDTNLHLLLSAGGDPTYNIVALKACQIANRSTNKDCIVVLYDGNDPSKPLAYLGCPSLDARDYTFDPPLVSGVATDIYCASLDALTTIYIAAQGYKLENKYGYGMKGGLVIAPVRTSE